MSDQPATFLPNSTLSFSPQLRLVILLTVVLSCLANNSQGTVIAHNESHKSAFISDEEFSGTGLLMQVTDIGYPFAELTIRFPNQPRAKRFTINLADVKNVQLATLVGWVGTSISFHYTTKTTNNLLDLQLDGRSLLHPNGGILPTETKKTTGVLAVDEVTTGNVPGPVFIREISGQSIEFSFFVTSDLLEVNGSTVVAFYEERTHNFIKAISLAR